jgi:hypothetical protein
VSPPTPRQPVPCPECSTKGEVPDFERWKNADDVPPMKQCPGCLGTGHLDDWPDEVKRAHYEIMTHFWGDRDRAVGSWVAIRRADGGSDHTLYDTKQDAIDHQVDERWAVYFCIPPDGVDHRGVASYLRSQGLLADAGGRMVDPLHALPPNRAARRGAARQARRRMN